MDYNTREVLILAVIYTNRSTLGGGRGGMAGEIADSTCSAVARWPISWPQISKLALFKYQLPLNCSQISHKKHKNSQNLPNYLFKKYFPAILCIFKRGFN